MQRSMRLLLTFAVAACASTSASKTDTSGSGASGSAMSSSGMQAGARSFKATMDSASEVPQPKGPVSATGTATFDVQGQTIKYDVEAKGLSSPFTAAHIHVGDPGTAGPVVVSLSMSDGGNGTASGSGTIDASAIKGKNPDGSPMSMQDVVALLSSGKAYVNVHTQNNKPGELRGQIQAAQ